MSLTNFFSFFLNQRSVGEANVTPKFVSSLYYYANLITKCLLKCTDMAKCYSYVCFTLRKDILTLHLEKKRARDIPI